jgi:hypothetical protein
MTYEETIELEENIKLKNEANEIYEMFLQNIKLEPKKYKGEGRFVFSQDSHNTTYITLKNEKFVLECRFLHESYDVEITPASIFSGLKKKYRGVDHLKAYVRSAVAG